jgi:ferredoxin
MRIRVDTHLCTGHALCQMQGPDVYVLNDLGFNETDRVDVPEGLWEQARRGALACPEGAIILDEEGGDVN